MQLITNKISTGKPGRFEDFIEKFKAAQVKTASVKTAEEKDEAESSGQLKVEPLHQTGESTTMPKAGPSAKKDDGEKAAATVTDKKEEDGPDSGQPKAEGSEKFTNNVKFDPNDSTDEEKGIDASADTTVKVAEETCEGCNCPKNECECKDCTAKKDEDEEEVKEAGSLPDALKEHQFKKKEDSGDDEEKEEKEEKEASAKCSKCDCDPCECKEAAAAPKFVKWANLDSKNKSFLTTYWRQLFGDDYVNALVADK